MNLLNHFPSNSSQWFIVLYFFGSLILLLGLAELLSRIFKLQKEFSRKFVHIVVGLLVVLFSINIENPQPIIFLSTIFTFVNFLVQKFNLLPAMESDRKTYGTIFYPFSIAMSAIFLWDDYKFVFIVVVLILALADASAAIVGQAVKNPIKYKAWQDEKSIQGNAAMFICSYLIIVSSYFALPDLINFELNFPIWIIALIVAFVVMISESISSLGSDNISVTVFAGLLLYIFIDGPLQIQTQFIGATIFAIVFSIAAYKTGLLTLDGSIAASLVALLIYGFGSWKFTFPILLFFISSNILGKAGNNLKHRFKSVYEKSSKRDAHQVFANGGIAVVWATIYFFYTSDLVYYLFVAAIAAANADTWATELGIFSKSKPRLITSFKKVEKGRSGGISMIGSISAFCGSLLISFSGFIFITKGPIEFNILIFLTIAGFLSSFVDSYLGASFQAQYQDEITGQFTEKAFNKMKTENKLISGNKWLNNDMVNFLSILTAPMFYYFLSLSY